MIKSNELVNRKYDGKNPVGFDYWLDIGTDEKVQPIRICVTFIQMQDIKTSWLLKTQFERTGIADTQCYYINYDMPREHLPLELICATGLRYLMMQMQDEIQTRSNVIFAISTTTEGM